MTISSPVSRVDCPGNGSATTFNFSPAVITQASDLEVWLVDNNGNQTVVYPGLGPTNYAIVTPFTYPGTGSISYPGSGGTVLPSGWKLVIKQQALLLQQFNPQNQGPFLAGAYMGAFDYHTLNLQHLAEEVSRSIQIPEGDPPLTVTLPTAAIRANKSLIFDGSGNPTVISSGGNGPFNGIQVVPTIAALRALTTGSLLVWVEGYHTSGDGGEGMFAVGTMASDNGGTIIVSSAGIYYRQTGGGTRYSVKWFGATGNGTTNDTASAVATIAALAALGGGVATFPLGLYLLDPFTVTSFVSIAGEMPGPFEVISLPTAGATAPTLLVNSTGSAFVTLQNSSVMSDLMVYYPQQVAPTASAPNVYPATVTTSFQADGCILRNCTLVNSYSGVSWSSGRGTIENCKIGSFSLGIFLDGATDWVFISKIMFQALYDLAAGLGVPQNIDAWVLSNGVGIQIGRADAVSIDNIGMFIKYAGIVLTDTVFSLSPPNGYGKMVNIDLDTCAFGVVAKSTDNVGGGFQFTNLNVGANVTGLGMAGQAALLLETGGAVAPKIVWNGGAVRGTWAAGTIDNTLPGSALAFVSNVIGVNPGLNPTPAFPNTGVNYVNNFSVSMRVFISGGSVSSISVNGTVTGLTSGMITVASGEDIAVAYTGSPSWVWFGE